MVIENFELNIHLFRLINEINNPFLNKFFYYFSYLGSGYVLIPLLIATYILRREKIKPFILAIILETVTVVSLKEFLNQPRPASLLDDVKLLIPLYWRSFPSGDTAMAFTIATVLSKGEKAYVKIPLFLYAFLIGFERIYVGVHFPLDVISGAFIGLFSGLIAFKIISGGIYERH
ncbi:lipid A 1-phosphatase LpxE [Aquifex pyrophilus]